MGAAARHIGHASLLLGLLLWILAAATRGLVLRGSLEELYSLPSKEGREALFSGLDFASAACREAWVRLLRDSRSGFSFLREHEDRILSDSQAESLVDHFFLDIESHQHVLPASLVAANQNLLDLIQRRHEAGPGVRYQPRILVSSVTDNSWNDAFWAPYLKEAQRHPQMIADPMLASMLGWGDSLLGVAERLLPPGTAAEIESCLQALPASVASGTPTSVAYTALVALIISCRERGLVTASEGAIMHYGAMIALSMEEVEGDQSLQVDVFFEFLRKNALSAIPPFILELVSSFFCSKETSQFEIPKDLAPAFSAIDATARFPYANRWGTYEHNHQRWRRLFAPRGLAIPPSHVTTPESVMPWLSFLVERGEMPHDRLGHALLVQYTSGPVGHFHTMLELVQALLAQLYEPIVEMVKAEGLPLSVSSIERHGQLLHDLGILLLLEIFYEGLPSRVASTDLWAALLDLYYRGEKRHPARRAMRQSCLFQFIPPSVLLNGRGADPKHQRLAPAAIL